MTDDVLPPGVTPGSPRFNALRWLAQLAVNIVDYIDSDDYITPFNWYTEPAPSNKRHWVYGTELPRLVVNEAYVEYDNDPSESPQTPPPNNRAQKKGLVNFWVELHNPFNRDPNLPDSLNS